MTRPLVAWYGDDFTGSTDVMEVLQWFGLRSVLFLDPPTSEELAGWSDLSAFGVAGRSRTMSPEEMNADLKPILRSLRDSEAAIVHYKVCSTFDSSPEIGNIGRAIELGREVFGSRLIPLLIGAPNLGRYQVFGNLFARSGLDTESCRLDRHPTMRHHPITPMTEADVRRHLNRQTDLRVGLVDILGINDPQFVAALVDPATTQSDVLLFDVLYPEHLPRIGQIIQSWVDHGSSRFVAGSSGIEYALTEYWSAGGREASLRRRLAAKPTFGPVDQLVVITGSCSPVNDRQVARAERAGFELLPLHPDRLIDPATRNQEIEAEITRALERLRRGANVILHSSRGPEDPRIAQAIGAFRRLGFSDQEIRFKSGCTLGPALGRILGGILAEHPLPRVGVAGGDTSGYIARELKITALEAVAPLAPGSPLCRASANNALDGVEFLFKGGQVGKDDVWETMLYGTTTGG
jgi:uncharacterized protein YgbK (DUF1537 family)